jgi:3-oxoacyl-[acyl-carrier protein] reductase
MNDQSLASKTIMVTGSSSGIGRAIAIEVARRGADVVLHGRTQSQNIESVKSEIQSLGRQSHAVFADFSRTERLVEVVDQAWSWQGKIDSWVNNAGGDVLTGEWSEKSLIDKLEYLLTVDVAATLLLSREVGKRMVELHRSRISQLSNQSNSATGTFPNGLFSILNIGWDQAMTGMGGDSGQLFSTTKGAIMAMSLSLAQSLAPAVRVNCLAPGWIQTRWGEGASEYWSRRARSESLMNRWGKPADIACAAAFLCSDQSSFVSGQILPVNGGFRSGTSEPNE